MKKDVISSPSPQKRQPCLVIKGPSLYEIEYMRQLKEELETFLKSHAFTTIEEVHIDFNGRGYEGHMQVNA